MLDAMAAGLTTKLMGLEDVVTLMDARAEKPNRPVTYKKAGSNFQTETHYLDIAAPAPSARAMCRSSRMWATYRKAFRSRSCPPSPPSTST